MGGRTEIVGSAQSHSRSQVAPFQARSGSSVTVVLTERRRAVSVSSPGRQPDPFTYTSEEGRFLLSVEVYCLAGIRNL